MKKLIIILILFTLFLIPSAFANGWTYERNISTGYCGEGGSYTYLHADRGDDGVLICVRDSSGSNTIVNKSGTFIGTMPPYSNWVGLETGAEIKDNYFYNTWTTGTPTSLMTKNNKLTGAFVSNTTDRCYADLDVQGNIIYAIYTTGGSDSCTTYNRRWIQYLDLNMNVLDTIILPNAGIGGLEGLYGAWVVRADNNAVFVFSTYGWYTRINQLYKYNKNTKTLIWNVTPSVEFLNPHLVTQDDNYLYAITSYGTTLYKFSKQDGSLTTETFTHTGNQLDSDKNYLYIGAKGTTVDNCNVYFRSYLTVLNKIDLSTVITVDKSSSNHVFIYHKPRCDVEEAFSCGELGVCTTDILCFMASVPEFIMNMIICIQPLFILLFTLVMASIIVLIMKKAMG